MTESLKMTSENGPLSDLKEKVVIITGSSQGIGAAAAVYFASLGSYVVVNGRNEEKVNKTVEDVIGAGCPEDKVLAVVADITIEEDRERLIQETIDHFGSLHVLVNNAGILKMAPSLVETTIEDFDAGLDLNLRALFRLMQLAIPHLKETNGNIVNVSSSLSVRPFVFSYPYCASKSAVDHLTRSAALELGSSGIRVNAVNPGLVDTELHVNAGNMEPEQLEEYNESMKAYHALGRIGKVEEISKAIAFLASDMSSFITGHVLLVDGGFNLMGPRQGGSAE